MRWLFSREESTLEPSSARFMDGWRRLRRVWRPSVRTAIDDELAFHLEMRAAEYEAAGLSAADAMVKASAQFGDVAHVSNGLATIERRRRRRLDIRSHVEAIATDLRAAERTLRTYWASSLVAIVTLTLAIGASIAVFSMVDAILIRPIRLPRPNELALLSSDQPARGMTQVGISGPDLTDIRTTIGSLAELATVAPSANVPYGVDGDPPEPLRYASVSTNIFRVLETPIVLGRNFIADDARPNPSSAASAAADAVPIPFAPPTPTRPRLVVIGYDYWQRRFHGDSSVLGHIILGPWGPTRIVGVVGPTAKLYLPTEMGVHTPDIWEASRLNLPRTPREAAGLLAIARLKPHVPIGEVQARLDSLAAVLSDRFPDGHGANGTVFRLENLHQSLVKRVRPALTALAGAVAALLLIACANVGNLLLLRGAARERELAIRAAIGGTAWRIFRQLLTESALLAATSTLVGVGIAAVAIRVVPRALGFDIPRMDEVAIDGRALTFAAGVVLLTSIFFGLVPALRASSARIATTLQSSGRTPSLGAAARLRAMVVVVEVALSFVLLIACGLMARTLINFMHADLGFDPRGVLTFTLSNRNFDRAADRLAFVHQVHDRVAGVPGVDGVTLSTGLPFSHEGTTAPWGTTPMLSESSHALGVADLRAVLPGYFDVLRISLVEGRAFSSADSIYQNVVIMEDASAKLAFGHASPIGKTIVTHILRRANQAFTVIGVVRHERHGTLLGDEHPIIYFPWSAGALEHGGWAVRVHGEPDVVGARIRQAIQSMPIAFASNTRLGGPNARHLIVNGMEPMRAKVDRAMGPARFVVFIVGALAMIAATLTAIGLYSVLASSVRQRTAEIGVRMAFGAEPRDIFSLVVKDGLRLSAVGLLLGAALALASSRMIASLLAGVRPSDPATYAIMSLAFLVVAVAATIVPARRAAMLDPNVALRHDAA